MLKQGRSLALFFLIVSAHATVNPDSYYDYLKPSAACIAKAQELSQEKDFQPSAIFFQGENHRDSSPQKRTELMQRHANQEIIYAIEAGALWGEALHDPTLAFEAEKSPNGFTLEAPLSYRGMALPGHLMMLNGSNPDKAGDAEYAKQHLVLVFSNALKREDLLSSETCEIISQIKDFEEKETIHFLSACEDSSITTSEDVWKLVEELNLDRAEGLRRDLLKIFNAFLKQAQTRPAAYGALEDVLAATQALEKDLFSSAAADKLFAAGVAWRSRIQAKLAIHLYCDFSMPQKKPLYLRVGENHREDLTLLVNATLKRAFGWEKIPHTSQFED